MILLLNLPDKMSNMIFMLNLNSISEESYSSFKKLVV